MTRPVRIGGALVALYVVVAAATASWAPGRLRPLFDGFGSHPGQYNWVNPPREFAAGNQRPEGVETLLELDASGSKQSSAGPGDGQIAVTLQPGALAAHPPDTEAALTLTPNDASTLGALPAGLRPESNAYRVGIVYEPSGTKVTSLDKPSSIGLIAAAPTDTLLYSADGSSWETVKGQPLTTGANGITGSFAATGYYLAASKGALRALSGGPGSGGGGATVLVLVAVGVVTLVVAWLLVGRRRPATPARGRVAPGRGRPPGGRSAAGQRAGPRGGKSGKSSGGKGKGGRGPTPRRK